MIAVALLLMVHPGGLAADGCHFDRRAGTRHCHRASASPPAPRSALQSDRSSERGYPSCAAARAAGAAPMRRGEPGYNPRLDGDGDGIACEPVRGGVSASPPAPRSSVVRPVPVYRPVEQVVSPVTDSAAAFPTPPIGATLTPPLLGPATIVDGDTIELQGQRVRLFGIDAFETEQARGREASNMLRRLIEGQSVLCSPRDRDAYGRIVAVCRVGATDLGAMMVRAGMAVAFTRYSLDYQADEQAAREQRRGAWADAELVRPEAFRGEGRAATAVAQRAVGPTGGCTIKGNINREGERIYHMPSDPYYARTRPEATFCSEEEARAAGFRRARSR